MKEIGRSEHYDLVWSEPIRSLAPRFEVSDVALRKACVKAAIPVPERGYWAKLQAGKPAVRVKLPPRPPGLSHVVQIGGGRYHMLRSPTREELLGPLPDPPSFPESIERVEERVRKIIGKVRPITSPDSPHHVVGRLLKADDERRQKQLESRFPSSWDAPLFDSGFEQRRLRILNTLFMAVAKAGAKPTIRGQEARQITIEVHDHVVGLRLDTPSNLKQDPRYARPAAAEAKAKLKLVILKGAWTTSERWTWEDRGERKIEQDIEEIAVRLVIAVELQHREHRTHHYKWWLERREQVIQEDRLAREKAEREQRERRARFAQERIDHLLAEAEALKTAETIRAYVERVRTLSSGVDGGGDIVAWAGWALKVADDIDPVQSGRFLLALEQAHSAGPEPLDRP